MAFFDRRTARLEKPVYCPFSSAVEAWLSVVRATALVLKLTFSKSFKNLFSGELIFFCYLLLSNLMLTIPEFQGNEKTLKYCDLTIEWWNQISLDWNFTEMFFKKLTLIFDMWVTCEPLFQLPSDFSIIINVLSFITILGNRKFEVMAGKPKLYYFNGRGKMESVRWLLAAAGVEVCFSVFKLHIGKLVFEADHRLLTKKRKSICRPSSKWAFAIWYN